VTETRTITRTVTAPAVATGAPVDGPHQPGLQGRAYDTANESCGAADADALAAKYGGRDVVQVAERFAQAKYAAEFQLSATRGRVDGLTAG
jgi:hypothetical protein